MPLAAALERSPVGSMAPNYGQEQGDGVLAALGGVQWRGHGRTELLGRHGIYAEHKSSVKAPHQWRRESVVAH
jgi:hypothetical protein